MSSVSGKDRNNATVCEKDTTTDAEEGWKNKTKANAARVGA